MTTSPDSDLALEVFCKGVQGLQVDWPNWSVIQVGALEIRDVTADQLEGVAYRIRADEDLFSFGCRTFEARRA